MKIDQRIDLFKRGEKYDVVKIDDTFPDYLLKNLNQYKNYIID